MSRLIAFFGKVITDIERIKNYCVRAYLLSRFEMAGHKIYIGKNCILSCENIQCGSDVYFGANCVIQSNHGKIYIGNHCMFGAGTHIHGGNHVFSVVGKYIDENGSALKFRTGW